MNRVYQVVWNQSKQLWQTASELGRAARGRSSGGVGGVKAIAAGTVFLITLPLHAAGLPSGGTVVGGNGSISGSDTTLTIQQNSQNMAINWQDFSIAEGHTVNFIQPNAQAAALNRVTGNNVSDIRGALNANGRVFLVNPNGVMFSSSAQVDVGSLVASTLSISTEDFMAGNYQFEGASANAIINQGNITTATGGVVAMIAARIINTGSITTPSGSTLMAAGSKVTLDLGGPVKIEVEEALLDTYIEQGGAIRADGGLVYLTAKAAGNLAASVINHTGVTEARTLAAGADGRIMLMGDMEHGTLQVAGTMDASAPASLNPNGGNGGFIETSAAKVQVNNVKVTTLAKNGQTGEWLIDPTNIEIVAGTGGDVSGVPLTSTSSSIGADTLVANLANSNITVQTPADGSEEGNITVSADIFWDANTTLTLDAHSKIYVNATIENANITGGGVYFDATPSSDMHSYTDNVIFTSDAKVVIHNVEQLQWVSQALAGNYELGSDIDASGTATWNGGLGFKPIKQVVENDMGGPGSGMGMGMTYGFMGRFDGRGHTIDGLTINRPDESEVGLFGQTEWSDGAEIKNTALTDVNIRGGNSTGALIGQGNRVSISNVSVSGSVFGSNYVGGLVGNYTNGIISASYADVVVTGWRYVGGLIGSTNSVNIANTYAMGAVSGTNDIGGLVGSFSWEGMTNSYASNSVSASGMQVGGLVGGKNSQATITGSYFDNEANTGVMTDAAFGKTKAEILDIANTHWDSSVWSTSISGADFAGYAVGTTAIDLPILTVLFKPSETLFEGGFGTELNPFTITNWNQLQNINHSSDILTSGYYFSLTNNIGSTAIGYTDQASSSANSGTGWNPIGSYQNPFNGTFDGQGHTLSNLIIDQPEQDFIGLFGYTSGAAIRNVGLVDANVTGSNSVGTLAGYANNSTTIRNVYATGTVSGTDRWIGGLVGLIANNSSITQSYATSAVTGVNLVGGLVGLAPSHSSINESYATGAVTGTARVGGLVGATASVGSGTSSHITNSYYATTDAAGNLINQANHSGAGTGKTTAELQTASTFADWDLSTTGGSGVWRLYEGQASPLLRNFMTMATVSGSSSDPISRVYDASTQLNNDLLNLEWVVAGGGSVDSELLGGGFRLDSKNVGSRTLASGLYSGQSGYDIIVDTSLTDMKVEVTRYALTLSGLSAEGKAYDGNRDATLTGTASINTFQQDTVTLSGTASGSFADQNAGTGKAVSLSGLSLAGTDATNYSLTLPTGLTANIDRRALTVSGITVADRTYDGTTAATVDLSAVQFGNLVQGEKLGLSASGEFRDSRAGTDKTVDLVSAYDEAIAVNYDITAQATTTANISKKAITISGITASDKTYDATTNATVDFSAASGWIANDKVEVSATGSFANKHAGDNKTVTLVSTYSGDDVGNYTITDQASATANISKKAITISGITASDKTYDATTNATVDFSAASGWIANDKVEVSATGSFANKHAGDNKTVTLVSTYSGDDVGNYTITDQASATASIAKKAIIIGGITASDKTYDATTNATVDFSAASGWIANDKVEVSATGSFANKNAGDNKTVTLVSTYSGEDVGNYTITAQASATASIAKKAITISGITAEDRVYDGTTDAVVNSVNAGGWISGDDVQVSANGQFSDRNAGTGKTVNLNASYSGTDADNYHITSQATTVASITPRALAVKAENQSKYPNQADPTLTYSTGCGVFSSDCGLVAGDLLSGGLARSEGEAVGRYSINQGTLANPNYAIEFIGGDFDIARASNPALDGIIRSIQQASLMAAAQTGAGTGFAAMSNNPFPSGQGTGLEVVDVDSDSEQALVSSSDSQMGGLLRMFVVNGGLNLGDDQ